MSGATVKRPTYSEVAMEWERYADSLESRLRREEEDHALLQLRCYEGFASASDGIFDALKSADVDLDQLRKEVAGLNTMLDEVEQFLEDREDVVDGDYGEPAPNKEMALLASIRRDRAARPIPGPEQRPRCEGCGNEIDPDTCGCGSPITHDAMDAGHAPIPMGCNCYRDKPLAAPGGL